MILHYLPNSSTEYDMNKKGARFRSLEDRSVKKRLIAGILQAISRFFKCTLFEVIF